MGFWLNRHGRNLITNSCGGTSGTSLFTFLTQYNPFKDLTSATCSDIAAYVSRVMKVANSAGPSMNAKLKAQMLATALDVYFSDPALGGNRINAPAPIGGVRIDLTRICHTYSDGGSCIAYENASSAFGGATCLTVSQLLSFAASQSNVGGSVWYGNIKATQELAKDTFDAINRQQAFTC